jgi:hypothetical protein
VSVHLHLTEGRWVASCGHCGGRLTGADHQADADAVRAALGVPVVSPAEEEAELASLERDRLPEGPALALEPASWT